MKNRPNNKILYEAGPYWVTPAPKGGFEVYKNGLNYAIRVAQIGYTGEVGMLKACEEADRRYRDFQKQWPGWHDVSPE